LGISIAVSSALIVSVARQLGSGIPLLAYYAAPLKPSGPEKAALGPLS
jgi:hypothetical protein